MAKNLRTYETVCLTKIDMTETQYKSMIEKCKAAIEENGKGEWGLVDDWGKAKISYPIEKEERAQWTYFRYKSMPEGLDELKRSLSINENVLRQLTNKAREDGSDYDPLKASIAKDLMDRDKMREWKDSRKRGSRSGGFNKRSGAYNRDGASYNNRDRDGGSYSKERSATTTSTAPSAESTETSAVSSEKDNKES